MLDRMLSQIIKMIFKSIAYLVMNACGHNYGPGFGKCLYSSRYVDALTMNVIAIVYHVTEVYPYTKLKCALDQPFLDHHRTSHGSQDS